MKKSRVLRPPGFVVFGVFLVAVATLWWLLADGLVQRGVEATGESIVGAKVELASVDLRPTEGSIRLSGLQVANPDAPMSNLFEAENITVDLMLEPLLEKKFVVQDLVVTGVRFNTPRETSGALENPDPEAGALWRQVNAWADQIELPELSLESLTGSVRTEAISADSLRTVQYARRAISRADSMRTDWQERLEGLDPGPRIDSLESVAQRLEAFRPTPVNALQLPELLREGRSALAEVTRLQADIGALSGAVREGLDSLRIGPDVVAELRAQDLAYARSLLDIPSLEAPSISPALFGGTALVWLKPVLFWARTAERYLPPGLDPRNRPGPRRARAEGTTVEFPGRATYPKFLLERGELGMEIAGTGAAAGSYTAQLTNLTTAPSLVGRPMEISLGRTEGAQGPRGLSLAALLDHTSEAVRDSVAMGLDGIRLPRIDLGRFGGSLDLGDGQSAFSLRRTGSELDARLRWVSTDVRWSRTEGGDQGPRPEIGTTAWARDLVWRTLAGVRRVELDMGISGSLDSPSISVASNLGEAVAESLQRELGAQIAEAEARVRQEVESRIQPLVQDARGRVEALRSEVGDRVESRRAEVDDVHDRLEARLDELAGRLPGGLPG